MIRIERFGFAGPAGQPGDGATLIAPDGTTARFIDRGATLTELWVADGNGEFDDVVLGFDDPVDYFAPHPHIGCIVGRCANRIRDSRFSVDGRTFELAPTHPPHHLHGGPEGFHTRRWELECDPARGEVRFVLDSRDGDQGYPGNLHATATYALAADGSLELTIEAECDRPTPINLTAHHYFNLAGEADPCDVGDHLVRIDADRYLPMGPDFLPTGAIAPVDATPFDLRTTQPLAASFASADPQLALAGKGFDHHFVINGAGMRFCAELIEPRWGRRLTMHTDQPGVQFYTGNSLDIVGKRKRPRRTHHGLCLETQGFPNAVNEPSFPSVLVWPGTRYRHTTRWRFDVVPQSS